MAYVHTELQATFHGKWYRRPCMSVDKNEVLGEIRKKILGNTFIWFFIHNHLGNQTIECFEDRV